MRVKTSKLEAIFAYERMLKLVTRFGQTIHD